MEFFKMLLRGVKPKPLYLDDLIAADKLEPGTITVMRALIGKWLPENFDDRTREQLHAIYKALGEQETGQPYLLSKGMFSDWGPPIEQLKVVPANPKRK
ncbi:hypothetical protein [Pseudomonas sp. IT-P218]|uniref:hypothetical protein n=1 Tax=Pseudomonas sp. IT-P218 TaxID=3026449 RepID=UPI0039E15413